MTWPPHAHGRKEGERDPETSCKARFRVVYAAVYIKGFSCSIEAVSVRLQ